MKIFNYTTIKGTKVRLIIKNLKDIVAEAKGKVIKCKNNIVFDYSFNQPIPAIQTELKLEGKRINLYITDEIYKFIKNLKEEERIKKLPIKEQLKEKIRMLKKQTMLLRFVDADLVTGIRYYALIERYEKDIWDKISKYFEYRDTSYHSDDFDAMYDSNYKGYLTSNPGKVQEILENILDLEFIKAEIEKLEKELATIEDKEQNDINYRQQIFKDDLSRLIKKYPDFEKELIDLSKKMNGVGKVIENNLSPEVVINTLLQKQDIYNKCVYKPENLLKITSDIYSDGYRYFSNKKHEDKEAIVPLEGDYIALVKKPKYTPEWWNNLMGDKINGYFAPFKACWVEIYKYKKNFIELLRELGFESLKYYETSNWFIVSDELSIYRNDLNNFITISDNYNYLDIKEDFMKLYKNEKRWLWEDCNYPKPEDIKYIGKFKTVKELIKGEKND